ncbi:hypothetical protein [Streptomyces sp. NPDC002516]
MRVLVLVLVLRLVLVLALVRVLVRVRGPPLRVNPSTAARGGVVHRRPG